MVHSKKKKLKYVISIILIFLFLIILFFLKQYQFTDSNFSISELNNEQYTPWGVKELGLSNETSRSIKIAVLDSGINDNHPELRGKIIDSYNAINPTKNVYDDNGHGTAVAGIISAINNNQGIVGIAPNALLYDVKVLDSEGKSDIQTMIRGLNWAKNKDVDIINISAGVKSDNAELKKAIESVTNSNIFVVASAGNNIGLGVDYPAKYKKVFSITAIDSELNKYNLAGKGKIDYAFPGVDILTTTKDLKYDFVSGTSFATAHFSGLLSIVLANKDLHSKQQFHEYIKPFIIDLGKKGYDDDYGFGTIKLIREDQTT